MKRKRDSLWPNICHEDPEIKHPKILSTVFTGKDIKSVS